MASRTPLGALLGLASSFAIAAACTNYTPPDVAAYGPPNGLGGKHPTAPGTSSSGGGSSSGGAVSEDAGTAPSGDGGGTTPTVTYACGTPLPASTCAVSWQNDIYPNMQPNAAWNCASSSCHGAGSVTQPVLSGTTSHSFYVTLANFTGTTSAGTPYLNPCSTDPTKSDFLCNVTSTNVCGTAQMPLGIAIADTSKIATWVACGAPEN